MKLLIVLAALVVVAYACHSDHECGHLTNCQSHQRPVCQNERCTCNDHHIGKREPGTCTDDDFSSCSCPHGGTPACKHGHCHCNHHAFKREPGTCTDDDFSSCSCPHGGTPACKHGHCHCNHHAFKREPGTCTDDDFSSCSCPHGGTPACMHGHCHCNHH